MALPRSSSSGNEIVDRIQENLIAYFRLFAGLPGAAFVEEDVTWFVNSRDEPGNHVLRAHISSDSIDRRIDEIIGQFGQYADQIDWLVFPGCRPTDLGKHLEARGMPGGPGGTWMLADLTSLSGPPAVPSLSVVKGNVNLGGACEAGWCPEPVVGAG